MVDSTQQCLNFAEFRLHLTGLPDEIAELPTSGEWELQDLVTRPVKTREFKREFELLAAYTSWKADLDSLREKELRAKQAEEAMSRAAKSTNSPVSQKLDPSALAFGSVASQQEKASAVSVSPDSKKADDATERAEEFHPTVVTPAIDTDEVEKSPIDTSLPVSDSTTPSTTEAVSKVMSGNIAGLSPMITPSSNAQAISAMIATPPPAATTPVQSHSDIVERMVELTKQEKDVCYFYLESANWDLDSAVALLNSMQAR